MNVSLESIADMKVVLLEEDIPFFSDSQLQWYVDKLGSYNAAVYECLMVKAQDTRMQIPGMSTNDTSAYFRRTARRYRPNNTGTLKGG